jgi:hypothetical protein
MRSSTSKIVETRPSASTESSGAWGKSANAGGARRRKPATAKRRLDASSETTLDPEQRSA